MYFLTESDREALLGILAKQKASEATLPWPFRVDNAFADDHQATDIYVARTPVDGIPALSTEATTGTSLGEIEDDQPGYATCDIYELSAVDGAATMTATGSSETVYNLSDTAVVGDSWIVIGKDKFGAWVAMTVAGAGGAGGSLTVQEEDGSSSVTGVSTAQIDQEQGGRVTSTIAGVALVSWASASVSLTGVVNTVAQTFAGLKTFADGAAIPAFKSLFIAGTGHIHFGSPVADLSYADIVANGGDLILNLANASGLSRGALSARAYNSGCYISCSGPTANLFEVILDDGLTGSAVVLRSPDGRSIGLLLPAASGTPKIQINNIDGVSSTLEGITYLAGLRTSGSLSLSGVSLTGATGTLGSGVTVDGGTW